MAELGQREPVRQIRSFVRRQGRMTNSQKAAIEKLWSEWGVDLEAEGEIDPRSLFAVQRPVVLEVGFGMGFSLAQMAEENREINYIGAEVHLPGVGNLFKLISERGLENVRVLNEDVNRFLNVVKPNSLAGLQLYFPDPWPKKRHHKRRIVQREWIEMLAGKLEAGGVLHMATDWEPYAEWMLEIMEASPEFRNCAGAGKFHPRPENRPLTKFEQRGHKLGHGVWDLIYERLNK